MELPSSIREQLVEGLDAFLQNFASDPDAEAVANFLAEELETLADDEGVDDVLSALEEAGELDVPFIEAVEAEMESNDEFEYTGEEIVSLLEKMCGIDWLDDDDDDDLEEEEEEEEVEEEE